MIVQVFIDGNISGKMKESFAQLNSPIIDTSNLTPEEVARKAVDIILSTNAK